MIKRFGFILIIAITVFFSTITASAVSMKYTDGTLTVRGLDTTAMLIRAAYNPDGTLNEINTFNVSDGENPISAEKGDKLMLWNSLDEMTPLCKVIDVGTYDGESDENSNKTLIAYFSRIGENYGVGVIDIGNTARIAGYINNVIDADVFEIVAKEPYSDVYSEATARAQQEQRENARPEFVGEVANMEQYDTVYIGYPIWYGTMPMIMSTFLEKYDMSGKTIIPFSTHEGSGWGSSLTDLKELCPNSTFLDGYSTRGQNAVNAENEVKNWLKGISGVSP